jgi:hypothetical protein
MYAAYSADFELMFSDSTLGRGAITCLGSVDSAMSFSDRFEQQRVIQEKILKKQATVQRLLALLPVL